MSVVLDISRVRLGSQDDMTGVHPEGLPYTVIPYISSLMRP